MRSTHLYSKGFSLIELMIVVAIMGIIAAIAYPSYQNSVRKANRADAKVTLATTAQNLERCFTTNGTFLNATCPGGETAPFPTINSDELFYTITIAKNDTTYTLTAAPTAGGRQVGDTDCLSFTLDNLGKRLPDACWR